MQKATQCTHAHTHTQMGGIHNQQAKLALGLYSAFRA